LAKFSRDKGAQFERDIANRLTALLGKKVQRNIGQARDGGDDITLPPYRIECKRRASIAVYAWLDQCAEACKPETYGMFNTRVDTPSAQIPVVVARADHREAIVIMRMDTFEKFLVSEQQATSNPFD
jgi:hypothetical protein